jgi:hypothetical protein
MARISGEAVKTNDSLRDDPASFISLTPYSVDEQRFVLTRDVSRMTTPHQGLLSQMRLLRRVHQRSETHVGENRCV